METVLGYFDEFDEMEEFDSFEELDDLMEEGLDEWEEDEFLGRAWGWLTQPGSLQRQLALGTARTALTAGLGLAGARLGKRYGGKWGGVAGGTLGGGLGRGLGALLPDRMDHFAALAAEADDEDEAEAFIGALIPLAARLLPRAGGAIMRVAPQLIRGAAGAARTLRSHPATRQLVRTLPCVIRRTGADIARQVAQGRPVTGKMAARRLAQNTYNVLRNPQQVNRVIRRTMPAPGIGRRMPVRLRR